MLHSLDISYTISPSPLPSSPPLPHASSASIPSPPSNPIVVDPPPTKLTFGNLLSLTPTANKEEEVLLGAKKLEVREGACGLPWHLGDHDARGGDGGDSIMVRFQRWRGRSPSRSASSSLSAIAMGWQVPRSRLVGGGSIAAEVEGEEEMGVQEAQENGRKREGREIVQILSKSVIFNSKNVIFISKSLTFV